jgi:hypothetical protein
MSVNQIQTNGDDSYINLRHHTNGDNSYTNLPNHTNGDNSYINLPYHTNGDNSYINLPNHTNGDNSYIKIVAGHALCPTTSLQWGFVNIFGPIALVQLESTTRRLIMERTRNMVIRVFGYLIHCRFYKAK